MKLFINTIKFYKKRNKILRKYNWDWEAAQSQLASLDREARWVILSVEDDPQRAVELAALYGLVIVPGRGGRLLLCTPPDGGVPEELVGTDIADEIFITGTPSEVLESTAPEPHEWVDPDE